ncbi:TonB-dependent receptor [Novosphingobium rosa]|uniref:TonB-dependent receptor n=1 Tax=Novosphingobium rosa TaxID=76978 RepID=UPI0008324DED|nr:TonB-dependent receptor [Novosphingobium rosa]
MKQSSCLAALCALMPATAFAQAAAPVTPPAADQAGQTGNDIVVTAQRRQQNLHDVPVSVAAVSGAELRTKGINNIVDVGRMIPGVTVASNTGGQAAAFSIRGVTLSDFNDSAEAPVAVYVDDTYLPNVQAQSSAMFDLDHVEVLKGPQGTLFGRNSTGGLVNLVVAKPTAETQGYINATYGAFNHVRVEGAAGGTISGDTTARVSLLMDRNDGWLRNLYPGKPDLGGQETYAARLQIQTRLGDNLTARLSGTYFHENMSSAPYTSIATTAVRDSQNRVVSGYYTPNHIDSLGYNAGPIGSRYTNVDYACSDCTGMRSGDLALHLNYDAGSFQILSTTDYYKIVKHLKLDGDNDPVNFLDVSTNGQTESFTQELRATGKTDKLVWNTGLYYLDMVVRTQSGYIMPAGSGYAALYYPAYAASGLDTANVTRMHKRSGSIFGQAEYEVLPRLTFTLGGRLIRESANYALTSNGYANLDNFNLNTDPSTYLFTAQPSYVGKNANTYWTGKVGLSYKPSRDWLIYASVNRGVRGSGYNNKLPGGAALTAAQVPYGAETLVSYEGGIKSTLLGGKLLLDAGAYHYDYSNYQAFLFLTAGGFVENANATANGAEAAITLRPVKGLELQGSGSYNKSTVHNLPIAPGVYRDVTPTYAPRRQLAASVSYTPPVNVANGAVTFSANWNSISSFYTNIRNFDSERLAGYSVTGLQIIWKNDRGFSFTGSITNLFDKHYAVNETDLSTLCGCTEITYGRPREYNLTVGYKF